MSVRPMSDLLVSDMHTETDRCDLRNNIRGDMNIIIQCDMNINV